jgi:hypothetical protein
MHSVWFEVSLIDVVDVAHGNESIHGPNAKGIGWNENSRALAFGFRSGHIVGFHYTSGSNHTLTEQHGPK